MPGNFRTLQTGVWDLKSYADILPPVYAETLPQGGPFQTASFGARYQQKTLNYHQQLYNKDTLFPSCSATIRLG